MNVIKAIFRGIDMLFTGLVNLVNLENPYRYRGNQRNLTGESPDEYIDHIEHPADDFSND